MKYFIKKKFPHLFKLFKNFFIIFYRIVPNKKIFVNYYLTNRWKNTESVSGPGSTVSSTYLLRKGFTEFIKNYRIKSILDLACGDFNWLNQVELYDINYTGIDIVPELIDQNNEKYGCTNIKFLCKDVSKFEIPDFEVILCRDLLVHYDFNSINEIIKNILKSDSKYLLITDFNVTENLDIIKGGWRMLNFKINPFYLPEPVLTIKEFQGELNKINFDKSLSLWEIDNLKSQKNFNSNKSH